MADISTKAIALQSLKYGDSSLIVKLFTQKNGIQSYLIKGVLKSKKGKIKPAYFQLLSQLQIVASFNPKRSLQVLKEVQVLHPYKTIPFDIVKQTICMFLAEVMSNSIQEEEENLPLYQYVENSLLWLDTHPKAINFHLLFLLNMLKYLGVYPNENEINLGLIDLYDKSLRYKSKAPFKLALLKPLLGTNFDTVEQLSFSKEDRQQILKVLIDYFEIHLDGFKYPKSLNVLETVFGK